MKIINIKEYKFKSLNENNKSVELPFNVKDSLANIVMARHNQWDGVQLLKASKIADKITNSKKQVILEDAEYEVLKGAVQAFKGYGKTEVEMVERVLHAKDYKVKK